MHSSADCIPLLITKGVSITALDLQGRSALQLACLCSDCNTVALLFDSGGWIDSLATACMLNATISGRSDTLTLLIERGISCSDVICDSTGYTLLHAAAAYGRLECAGVLMREGYDASVLTNDGVSPVNIAFADSLPTVLQRARVTRPAWCDRQATALMLLKHGVSYDASSTAMHKDTALLIKQHLDELNSDLTQLREVLKVHADNTQSTSVATIAVSASEQISGSHAAASVVRVQLYDRVSSVKSLTVYTLDTALLANLEAAVTSDSVNTLLHMLAPADSWGATGTTETPALTDTGIRAISYDGKCHC
jgi:Ankyrin repeats (many copies)